MTLLTLYAALHQMVGDLTAILALIGSIGMLLNPFGDVD